MKSIKDIYKIGKGPSSSHTMGPARAMAIFRDEHPEAERFEVTLFGSLAKTGKGHGTDVALRLECGEIPVEIILNTEKTDLPHENTMEIRAYRDGAQ